MSRVTRMRVREMDNEIAILDTSGDLVARVPSIKAGIFRVKKGYSCRYRAAKRPNCAKESPEYKRKRVSARYSALKSACTLECGDICTSDVFAATVTVPRSHCLIASDLMKTGGARSNLHV